MDRRGTPNLTIEQIIAFVLIAILIFLVVFGLVSGAFGGVKDKIGGYYDKVLIMLNFKDKPTGDVLQKKGIVLGEERNVTLDVDEKRCIVELSVDEAYSLNFKEDGRLEVFGIEKWLWGGIVTRNKVWFEVDIGDDARLQQLKKDLEGICI